MVRPEVVIPPHEENQNPNLHAAIRCPGCKIVGWIDADQFDGKVSIWCTEDGCDYHETHDLREVSD